MKIYGIEIKETTQGKVTRWEYVMSNNMRFTKWTKQQQVFDRTEMIEHAKKTILNNASKLGVKIPILERIKTFFTV